VVNYTLPLIKWRLKYEEKPDCPDCGRGCAVYDDSGLRFTVNGYYDSGSGSYRGSSGSYDSGSSPGRGTVVEKG
jgi:hypothetical protein